MTFRLALCTLFAALSVAYADTTWVAGGEVSGEWTIEGSPFIIEGDILVALDFSLTIQSGVHVLFTPTCAFQVQGLLEVLGTETGTVAFVADTTNISGMWGGIHFSNSMSGSRMEYAVIECAISGLWSGAALTCDNSDLALEHTMIRFSQGPYGRALYVDNGSYLEMRDCEVSHNTFENGGLGAALNLSNSSTARLERCIFRDNSALDGGALAVHDAVLYLTDCQFYNNSAQIWGGAIKTGGLHTFVGATGCLFESNQAQEGGAINIRGSTVFDADYCLFLRNRAGYPGYTGYAGAICCNSMGFTISNCTFFGNEAEVFGCIYAEDNTVIRNSIFANTVGSAAVHLNELGGEVEHCDFINNTGGSLSGIIPDDFGDVTEENANGDPCDIYFNIFLDPQFVDTASSDFHLTAASPCIDAGDPEAPSDSDGTVSDIGAFYFSQPNRGNSQTETVRSYSLHQNYPNPFNSSTIISYSLPLASDVLLNVFDITGREIATLVDGMQASGQHRVMFDAGNMPSGVYVYRLQAGRFSQSQKLVLLR